MKARSVTRQASQQNAHSLSPRGNEVNDCVFVRQPHFHPEVQGPGARAVPGGPPTGRPRHAGSGGLRPGRAGVCVRVLSSFDKEQTIFAC